MNKLPVDLLINFIWALIPIGIAYFLYRKAPLTSKSISIVLVISIFFSISQAINIEFLMEIPYIMKAHIFLSYLVSWLFIWNALYSKIVWHNVFAWIYMFFSISGIIAMVFYM